MTFDLRAKVIGFGREDCLESMIMFASLCAASFVLSPCVRPGRMISSVSHGLRLHDLSG